MKAWVVLLFVGCSAIVDATRKASCNGWTLTAPNEGSFSCTPAGVIISMPGTRCTLGCDAGYRPEHEVLVCSESGGWIPTNTPECQADSTMTLVIVLSIVGSIVIIFGLSVLYARTSKRCRGKRRKLDEDDPESGLRKIQDTSTYYGQVKRLQRKRRLQAERQRRLVESKRIKDGTMAKSAKKPSEKSKRKSELKRPSNITNRTLSKNSTTQKKKRKEIRITTKDPRKIKPRRSAKDRFQSSRSNSRKKSKRKKDQKSKRSRMPPKESVASTGKSPRRNENRSFRQTMIKLFCIPLWNRGKSETKETCVKRKENPMSVITEVNVPKKVVPEIKAKRRQSAASSSSSSSSSSSRKSSEKETTSANLKNATQKPSNSSKKPPPRPPAPILPTRAARAHDDASLTSEDEGNQNVMSSGYSSEGEKYRKKKVASESEKNAKPPSPRITTNGATNKRIEIMSYGLETDEKETGNPYDHYPAALSYRKYQNFENDYRRTTGDYHPQYNNVQLIPLSGLKKKQNKPDDHVNAMMKVESEDKKPTQGGVKYISISDKNESDEEGIPEAKRKKNCRKRMERYDDPPARVKKKNSPNYQRRYRSKKSQSEKKSQSKIQTLDKRKKEIGGERIIDNGKDNDLRSSSRTEKNAPNHNKLLDKEGVEKSK